MKKLFIGGIIFFSCLSAIHGQTLRSTTPTLSANATQICFDGTSYPLLNIVSGSGPSYVGSVIDDPTDPIATKGIYFTASNATGFSFASSNNSVVNVSNISMTLVSGTTYVLKIKPTGVGYATITVQATNGSNTATYTMNVAASAASAYGANTVFPTIIADASAVAAVDSNYMFIADDETNVIRMFNRKMSGQSLYTLDITSGGGGKTGEEFDLEAATVSSSTYNNGRRIYWIGSLGNSKSGASKPYRDRVIATDMSGTGVSTTLTVKSYSANVRSALITWGDANGWGFTASAYAASSGGMIPKRIDGFNIEGLSVTHAGQTAYIGFRAPCVPIKGTTPSSDNSNRKYALLAPVTNFETMMNVSGKSSITPTIGEPVLFDFGGLGIRDLVRVGNNKYILIAGLYEGGGTPAVYLWDGVVPANPGTHPITTATSSLVKLPLDLTDLVQPSADGGVEGHPEAILAEQVDSTLYIHLICDNGTVVYYNDAQAAKSLSESRPQYSKFRMDTYTYTLPTITTNAALTKVSSVSWTVVNNKLEVTGLQKGTVISVFNPKGQTIASVKTDSEASVNLPTKGIFIVSLSGNGGSRNFKVLNK
jgi:hypothetical protein